MFVVCDYITAIVTNYVHIRSEVRDFGQQSVFHLSRGTPLIVALGTLKQISFLITHRDIHRIAMA